MTSFGSRHGIEAESKSIFSPETTFKSIKDIYDPEFNANLTYTANIKINAGNPRKSRLLASQKINKVRLVESDIDWVEKKSNLKDFLIEMVNNERRLEASKLELIKCADFNLIDLFKQFDS